MLYQCHECGGLLLPDVGMHVRLRSLDREGNRSAAGLRRALL
jgi:hypothetical protein